MKVEKKNENEACLTPGGRIDISNSQEFKQQLLRLYDEGFNYIKMDFRNVTAIDSSGLGKLLLLQKKLVERGGELSIVNINEHVKRMFSMIHLYKVIKIEGLS